jgi:hypothetical protein
MSQSKFSKKTSFSRDRKSAYCESDMTKHNNKLDEYKITRGLERERNIKIANGESIVCSVDQKTNEDKRTNSSSIYESSTPAQERFYYEKMNLIINGISSSSNIINNADAILREFSPYGKIIYTTQLTFDSQGYSNSKLVIDHWYDEVDIDMSFIIEVQTAILKDGKYKWFCCNNSQLYITKDPEQTVKEMGCKIIMDEE